MYTSWGDQPCGDDCGCSTDEPQFSTHQGYNNSYDRKNGLCLARYHAYNFQLWPLACDNSTRSQTRQAGGFLTPCVSVMRAAGARPGNTPSYTLAAFTFAQTYVCATPAQIRPPLGPRRKKVAPSAPEKGWQRHGRDRHAAN